MLYMLKLIHLKINSIIKDKYLIEAENNFNRTETHVYNDPKKIISRERIQFNSDLISKPKRIYTYQF